MTRPKPLPDSAAILAVVRPDLEAGRLFWRDSGKEIGLSSKVYGAPKVKLLGGQFYLHRVLYKLARGVEPDQIDHVDGNRSNNAIGNLRAATHALNMKNKAQYRNNRSGHSNVYRDRGKWRVQFKLDGQKLNFGTHASLDEALRARNEARTHLSFHENHGRAVK